MTLSIPIDLKIWDNCIGYTGINSAVCMISDCISEDIYILK